MKKMHCVIYHVLSEHLLIREIEGTGSDIPWWSKHEFRKRRRLG